MNESNEKEISSEELQPVNPEIIGTSAAPVDTSAQIKMQNEYIKHQNLKTKFTNGRKTILTIAILSALNMGLLLIEATISFPFSLAFPTIIYVFAKAMENEYMISGVVTIIALLVGALDIGMFFFLYHMSKKKMWAIWTALVLFIIDTFILVALVFIMNTGFASSVIDFLFHGWAVFSLGQLIRDARNLKAYIENSGDENAA